MEVVRDANRLSALGPAWAELADAAGARAFARPAWCRAWWEALGRGELAVVTVRSGTDLVALAPFHVRRRAPMYPVRFLGHGLGAVSAPVVEPGATDAAARLWDAVLGRRRVLDLIEFDERTESLTTLQDGPWAVRIEPRDICPVIRLSSDFDGYLASRSSDLRRILRRAHRRLEGRRVEHTVEVASDPDAVARLLPDVVRITDAAEAAKPRQHLFEGRWAGFTRTLLSSAAAVGDVHLFVGRVGGEPSAYAVLLRDGGGLAMWLNRHDPAFADVAPGHLLLHEMVRHGCGHGVTHLDLLIGDDRYKRLWANDRYQTLTVTAALGRRELALAERQAAAVERIRSLAGDVQELRHRRGAVDPSFSTQ